VRVIKVKFEFVLPFFLAVFLAMNFCGLITLRTLTPPPVPAAAVPEEVPEFMFSIEGLSSAFLLAPGTPEDVVFDRYREPASREWVISFFTYICGSRDIAEVILANADFFNVSPSLAFALCWEESRYKPTAVNRRNLNGSIDRGLFQLNNRSFPSLTDADLFNPQINARNGMAHLRWCLDSGGSEITALAMYNAGTGRVGSTGAPKHTLDYISRIFASRQKIDSLFHAELARAQESSSALAMGLVPEYPAGAAEDLGPGTAFAKAEDSAERFRFPLLSPFSGKR
jgi:hypothetical protein